MLSTVQTPLVYQVHWYRRISALQSDISIRTGVDVVVGMVMGVAVGRLKGRPEGTFHQGSQFEACSRSCTAEKSTRQ